MRTAAWETGPRGPVDGVRPAWTDTLSGSSDGHSSRANGASVEPGQIGYRGRHTASCPRWSTLQPADLSVAPRTITDRRIARRRRFPGAGDALERRGQALSPRGCDGDTGDDKGRRKHSARTASEGVQWPRNGVGRRLSRVAWVTPDELEVDRVGDAGEDGCREDPHGWERGDRRHVPAGPGAAGGTGTDRWKGPVRAVSEQSRRGPDGADGHCHEVIRGVSGGGGRIV